MDGMFNNGNRTMSKTNGHTVMTHEDNDAVIDVVNDDDQSSTDAAELSINKRKLAATGVVHPEQQYQENENDNTKRLCTMNGRH
jgi:hypothetical protein